MWSTGQQWTVIGADGTTFTANGPGDKVYVLDVSGFETAPIRLEVAEWPEADGGVVSDAFYGPRPVTMSGIVVYDVMADRNAKIANMVRAFRSLTADVTLKTYLTGVAAQQISGRCTGFRLNGNAGPIKEWFAEVICADPRVYNQTATTGSHTSATPSVTLTNLGNYNSPPTITLTGPVNDPLVTNTTSGEYLQLSSFSLAGAATLTIDMRARTVTQSGVSKYGSVVFPSSKFWTMRPGSNTVTLTGGGTTGSTVLQVSFRDAWL